MENLTEEQIKSQPLENLGKIVLLKLAEDGINADGDGAELTAEATFNGKRYKCKMSVTWREI